MEELGKLPRHVAIIMDGNGRWAQRRGLRRFQGHLAGAEAVRPIVEEAARLGIQELTLYSFSTENWRRPKEEVTFLMNLLARYLEKEMESFCKHNIQVRAIGELERLPRRVREILLKVIRKTSRHTGLILRLAVSYGGRREILEAVRKIALEVLTGKLQPEEIGEEEFRAFLYDPMMADPDLIIRTSGEMRLSNFLLWQGAYAEFWVTPTLWPDFTVAHFHEALRDYSRRERRFGGVGKARIS